MDKTPTLEVFNARLDSEDMRHRTLVMNLAPFGTTNTLSADRALSEEILRELRIKAAPVRWLSTPFRTEYYSDPEGAAADRWRIVWELRVEVDMSIAAVPLRRYEFFEVERGGGYAITPTEDSMNLEYRAIADFQQADAAEGASTEISRRFPDARISRLALGDQFVQLVATFGPFAPEMFSEQFDLGEGVSGIMRAHRGIPNKTEREDSWDIVYNEEGEE
jgi:hypothetical protein